MRRLSACLSLTHSLLVLRNFCAEPHNKCGQQKQRHGDQSLLAPTKLPSTWGPSDQTHHNLALRMIAIQTFPD